MSSPEPTSPFSGHSSYFQDTFSEEPSTPIWQTPKKAYRIRHQGEKFSFLATPTAKNKEVGGWIYRVCLQQRTEEQWSDTTVNYVGGTNQSLAGRVRPICTRATQSDLQGDSVWDFIARTHKGDVRWLKDYLKTIPKAKDVRWVVYAMKELEPGQDFGEQEDSCIEHYNSIELGLNKRKGGAGSRTHQSTKKRKVEAAASPTFKSPLRTPKKVWPIRGGVKNGRQVVTVLWSPSAKKVRQDKSKIYSIMQQEKDRENDGQWLNTQNRKVGLTDLSLARRYSNVARLFEKARPGTIEHDIFKHVQNGSIEGGVRYVFAEEHEVPSEQGPAAEAAYAKAKGTRNLRGGGGGGRAKT